MSGAEPGQERILILAPTGRDNLTTAAVLQKAALSAETCNGLPAFLRELSGGVGVALVAEEALLGRSVDELVAWIELQPPWSDLPILMLTSHREAPSVGRSRQVIIERLRNVSLIERPVQPITLVSAVRAALRARRHQYRVRNHILARHRAEQELEGLVSERTQELEAALAASTRLVTEFEQRVHARTKELEGALSISKLLLHEVDHRVKNNLQMISAMLMLQSMSIPDDGIKNTLQEMLERIEAMGLVHKRLYQSENIMDFDLGEFTREIATNLVGASGRADIDLVMHTESVKIRADDAASVALIINETITNALKHAFPAGRPGDLRVSVKSETAACEIAVEDNGVGLNESASQDTGFGRALIETLALQLRASIAWTPAAPGTCVRIVLPIR